MRIKYSEDVAVLVAVVVSVVVAVVEPSASLSRCHTMRDVVVGAVAVGAGGVLVA